MKDISPRVVLTIENEYKVLARRVVGIRNLRNVGHMRENEGRFQGWNRSKWDKPTLFLS